MSEEAYKPEPKDKPETYGLPVRIFLYTVDQIATMLGVSENQIKSNYLHFDGRSIGKRTNDRMLAHNIAEAGKRPDWRVAEHEFIRFMKYRGFKVYTRGWGKE